ncbi:MAG: N-acylneuraminate cytidylyltransferase [Parcubacteria group bacterium Gr01-1014_33]|nr:MAG: N-acylneuraminate cytidylyltransferase [Parcubacteria group bacterium Gr01-1014_33]
MEVLAIIQARGGSKGIPGKNIKPLAGRPLIAWTISAAKAAKTVNRVIISTDDEEIAEVSRACGAEVPFLRPKEFATDGAKSIGLLKHALEWLAKHEHYHPDAVVQLKPTNPLRRAEHIDQCVEEFFKTPGIDSLITITKSPAHPLKTWKFENEFLAPFIPEEVFRIHEAAKMPRQALPEAFVQNSCVHVIHPDTILKKNSSIGTRVKGVVMDAEDSINIDRELDFEIAELIFKRRKII